MPNRFDITELDKLLVERLWADEKCPYFDLIMHGDGKILPLPTANKNDFGMSNAASDSWIPISQVPNIDDENKLNEGLAVISSKELRQLGLRISCRESFSSGSNGFISLSRASSGKLVWLAFFVESNPFDFIELNNDVVVAKSTDGTTVSLNLNNPASVNRIRSK